MTLDTGIQAEGCTRSLALATVAHGMRKIIRRVVWALITVRIFIFSLSTARRSTYTTDIFCRTRPTDTLTAAPRRVLATELHGSVYKVCHYRNSRCFVPLQGNIAIHSLKCPIIGWFSQSTQATRSIPNGLGDPEFPQQP